MLIGAALLISALFGLVSGQSANLNVLLAIPPATTTASPTLATVSCDVTLSFLDGQSNTLKSTEVTVSPGGSATLSLSAKELKIPGSGRLLVYGKVQLAPDSDANCLPFGSLELVDSNGRIESVTPFGQRAVAAAPS